jgi:hypothetical protein
MNESRMDAFALEFGPVSGLVCLLTICAMLSCGASTPSSGAPRSVMSEPRLATVAATPSNACQPPLVSILAECVEAESSSDERCALPIPVLRDAKPDELSFHVTAASTVLSHVDAAAIVTAKGNQIHVKVRTASSARRAHVCLDPLFASATDLQIESAGRAPASLAILDASTLDDRFVTDVGLLKTDDIWKELVNGFSQNCSRELDSQSLSRTASRRSVATHEFAVQTSNVGIVSKGQLYLAIANASEGLLTDATAITVSLESRFWWRRASDNRWHAMTNRADVSRDSTGTSSGTADSCEQRLYTMVKHK